MERTSEEPRIEDAVSRAVMTETKIQPRVLVIDDEPLLGQTIRLGLGGTLDVTCELSGEQGLNRALGSEDYAVVLCDLSLPDRPGAEIYDELRAKKPELSERFVVMTGGAVSDEARAFLERYEGPLLTKPFTLSDVEKLVTSLLPDAELSGSDE